METKFKVSVIIPTYNRPDSVLKLLDSLCTQTLSPQQFEVIVVDDGSTYDEAVITKRPFPFSLQYIRQQNSGATITRNNGAQHSQGEVLVVIDDDVTVAPEALQALSELCLREEKVLVMGTLITRSVVEPPPPFIVCALGAINKRPHAGSQDQQDREVHFSWANTQLLAVKRADFYELGMLQDPTGGWPNWDDVDFGYRAHLAGFRLLQSGQATGYHWDNSLRDLESTCNRWQRACKSAVRLFEVHPGLIPHLPMLHDKMPINWSQDSANMVARKLLRRVLALGPSVWLLQKMAQQLERGYPARKKWLCWLYLLIQGSYMSRGYREGLRVRTAGGAK
ncbi:MAG: glycosyltransferase [Ardenticatenaceae bacterium]|nr:glycosyltransferase [Ardenticatenaceae bacterium]